VLVDKELLEILFDIIFDPINEEHYKHFYLINADKEVECYQVDEDGWEYAGWRPISDAEDLDYMKKEGFLCPELSNLSFEDIEKLGETQEPGVYFKGKKVWDL
jgi:hypothetical protein